MEFEVDFCNHKWVCFIATVLLCEVRCVDLNAHSGFVWKWSSCSSESLFFNYYLLSQISFRAMTFISHSSLEGRPLFIYSFVWSSNSHVLLFKPKNCILLNETYDFISCSNPSIYVIVKRDGCLDFERFQSFCNYFRFI